VLPDKHSFDQAVAKLVGDPGTTTCIRQACHGKPEELLLKNKYLI
jgi:hypothetical protein